MKRCKLHMMNRSIMDAMPSNIIFNIFTRLHARYLARCRCVSKVWCSYIDDRYLTIIHDKRVLEEPTPILYHHHLSCERITLSLCFHVIESKQAGTTDLVFKPTKGPFLEFLRKEPLSRSSLASIETRGSCNGLIFLSQDDGHKITSLVVIHPLRKECYELPPLRLHFQKYMRRHSCGLGFDTFTNTYKMVCVLLKKYVPPKKSDMVRKNLCTMVHVFGTNSWREISQVPSYPISGKVVFANGYLYWLVSYVDMKTEDGGREVIWFDVNKEEFGLIKRPKRMCDLWRNYSCSKDQLVDLNGEVGYVCCRTMEVWVLNKQKEWMPHCRFEKGNVPYGYIDVIGCWNKDGDILIKCKKRDAGRYIFCVYNLKSGVLHETNVAGREGGHSPNIFMYPNTLSSIYGINTNCFSMKKTDLKQSCRDLLSLF